MKTEVVVSIVIAAFFLGVILGYHVCQYGGRGSSDLKVKYFYSPGCPHCRHFMPAFDQFANESSKIADIEKIDCTQFPELCSGIRGVPHVVFSKNGSDKVYNGERTKEGLKNFLREVKSK